MYNSSCAHRKPFEVASSIVSSHLVPVSICPHHRLLVDFDFILNDAPLPSDD